MPFRKTGGKMPNNEDKTMENADKPLVIDLDDYDDDQNPPEQINSPSYPWRYLLQDINKTSGSAKSVPFEEFNNPNKGAQDDQSPSNAKKPRLSQDIYSGSSSLSNDLPFLSVTSNRPTRSTFYEQNTATNSRNYLSGDLRATATSNSPNTILNSRLNNRPTTWQESFLFSLAVTTPSVFKSSTPISQTQQVLATNSHENGSGTFRYPPSTSTMGTFNYSFPPVSEPSPSTDANANENTANATSGNRIPNNANNLPVSSVSDHQVGYNPWWKKLPPVIENEVFMRQATASYFQNQRNPATTELAGPQWLRNPRSQNLENSNPINASLPISGKEKNIPSKELNITVSGLTSTQNTSLRKFSLSSRMDFDKIDENHSNDEEKSSSHDDDNDSESSISSPGSSGSSPTLCSPGSSSESSYARPARHEFSHRIRRMLTFSSNYNVPRLRSNEGDSDDNEEDLGLRSNSDLSNLSSLSDLEDSITMDNISFDSSETASERQSPGSFGRSFSSTFNNFNNSIFAGDSFESFSNNISGFRFVPRTPIYRTRRNTPYCCYGFCEMAQSRPVRRTVDQNDIFQPRYPALRFGRPRGSPANLPRVSLFEESEPTISRHPQIVNAPVLDESYILNPPLPLIEIDNQAASNHLPTMPREVILNDVTIRVDGIAIDGFLINNIFANIGQIESVEIVNYLTTIFKYHYIYVHPSLDE